MSLGSRNKKIVFSPIRGATETGGLSGHHEMFTMGRMFMMERGRGKRLSICVSVQKIPFEYGVWGKNMEVQHTIPVSAGSRRYSIEISRLERLGEMVSSLGLNDRILIITDENVDHLYGERAAESLAGMQDEIAILTVVPGEPAKSLLTAEKLWERLAEMRVDRRSTIVALGGGVVGDLAGFIAATWMRGIPFVQVPTTLLAQVDSSVGGKVGINLHTGKNLVGAFWQPHAVLIDPTTLETLPEREYLSGLGEVVKYGMIMDAALLERLEAEVDRILARDSVVLGELIARCCRLKADVVEQDEFERLGVREILNYGHTFGHALESITHYRRYLHGEAVAIGMDFAARLAARLGMLDPVVVQRQRRLIEQLGLPVTYASPSPGDATISDAWCDELLRLMQCDKKNESGGTIFVLPQHPGRVERVRVEQDLILETLRDE